MTSLTSLPPIRPAVLGLLLATLGIVAPAQESHPPFGAPDRLPALPGTEDPLDALLTGPAGPAPGEEVSRPLAPSPPPPAFRKLEDGTTVVTIRWDTNNGKSIERRTAELVVTTVPVPEPTPMFFGACAGCVLLLHRRRTMPSRPRRARANSLGLPPRPTRTHRPAACAPHWRLAPATPPRLRRRAPVLTCATAVGRHFPRP